MLVVAKVSVDIAAVVVEEVVEEVVDTVSSDSAGQVVVVVAQVVYPAAIDCIYFVSYENRDRLTYDVR